MSCYELYYYDDASYFQFDVYYICVSYRNPCRNQKWIIKCICKTPKITKYFYIIFYWLCYYSCASFSPLPLHHPAPPLPQAIPTPLFLPMGHVYKFFGYSISYTVHPHGYSVTTYLYFLIPSLLHPFSHNTPPIWQPSKWSRYL